MRKGRLVSGDKIPITPLVLKWARERARYSIEEASADFRGIESWEAGETSPTYPQLERLSEAFKIPLAVFFFPEPPDVPPIRESFRTLLDRQFDELPRAIRFLLRKAKAFQINLSELNDGSNPAENFILRDLHFTTEMNIPKMALRVREYLGVSLEEQIGWSDTDSAFEFWRAALENRGIAIFKDAFRDSNYSGFCLYDESFPIIYVNNSVKTRQIFTLFHELAHLLFQTSGINTVSGAPEDDLPLSSREIEVICNLFAAEFLLPESRFEEEFRGLLPNEQSAAFIANRYHVSRESIFRRFLDRGLVTQNDYLEAAKNWGAQRQASSGGNHYWTKISYLGTNYLNLAFSRYHQNRITEVELADYLDIKVKNLTKLEDYYLRKVV